MTDEVVDLEEFANEALQHAVEPRPRGHALILCPACRGTGREGGGWSPLWGGDCWICSGWQVVWDNQLYLQGQFAPDPRRHPPGDHEEV